MASLLDGKSGAGGGRGGGGRSEGSHFQHIFKMQMIKRERKASTLQSEKETVPDQSLKIKQKPRHIINLLINCPQPNSTLRHSLDSTHMPTPPNDHQSRIERTLSSSQHLIETLPRTTFHPSRPAISHCQIKVCDGVWRIKQLSKAYQRQKLSLLQRYKCKMRRKELSGEPILATSISPLSQNPYKNTLSSPRPKQKEGRLKESKKASYRYRDIPISQFIYEKGLTRSDHAIHQGMQRRMEEVCRRRNTRPLDSMQP